MRVQPTKVEELDAAKPGLRQLIDLLLDAMRPLEEIQERVKKQFGEEIALSTLSSYKTRRWIKAKQRIQEIKSHAQAIIELLGSYGVSEVRRAMLYEQIQAAMDAGAKLDPHFMISEERRWAELDNKRMELEQAKEKLRLTAEKLTAEREREQKQLAEAVGEGEKDPRRALERIREIYGIVAGPPGSGTTLALPGKVAEG